MTVYLLALTLLFLAPLARLMAYVWGSSLNSHILLVPFVVAYLVRDRWPSLPLPGRRSMPGALLFAAAGAGAAAAALAWRGSLSLNDDLALSALAYAALVVAGGFYFMGAAWMRAVAFPAAFLLFLIPIPDAAVTWLEQASASASADAAALYFALAGTTHVRHGTVFELPGIIIQVAQECSGIRSSWVLFITSILAANLFLRSPWRRLLLVAFVIPLGILRNGFRVFVISELCIRIGPHMIDSVIHHRGGPIFFALSLGPLFGLLWWLRRGDTRG